MRDGYLHRDASFVGGRPQSTSMRVIGVPSDLGLALCYTSWNGCMSSMFNMMRQHSIPIHSSRSPKVATRSFRSGYHALSTQTGQVNYPVTLRAAAMLSFPTRYLRIPPCFYCCESRHLTSGSES